LGDFLGDLRETDFLGDLRETDFLGDLRETDFLGDFLTFLETDFFTTRIQRNTPLESG
jgi:hypothetical protein